MKKSRLKTPAAAIQAVPDRDGAASVIRQIGDLQRAQARQVAQMNDDIAAITETHQPAIDAREEQIKGLMLSVQMWAEANRTKLCAEAGDKKTVNLITGTISWRQRPPSVTVRGVESVLQMLKQLGLTRFIRNKEELNKDAILNEPNAVRGVAGITINQGNEDFAVEPFEVEVQS